MNTNNHKIIEAALAACTVDEADAVQQLIANAVGARHQRPLGDTWNNQGILTGSGSSYDHKALEVVTNMQDAVLELRAIQQYGSRAATPFDTPQAAAAALLAVNRPGCGDCSSLRGWSTCQESGEGSGIRPSCGSGRCGWSSITRAITRRSGQRSVRSPRSSACIARRCGCGFAAPRSMAVTGRA